MKKLGKSLSFLTKIMLVVGLLISNLSSLTVVFASETKIDISVVDDKLYIDYLDELADEVESVKVNVYENYTYLDGTYYIDEVTSLKGKVSSYELSFKDDETLVDTETENTDTVVDETVLEDVQEDTQVENTDEVTENVDDVTTELDDIDKENAELDNTNVENENTEVVEDSAMDTETTTEDKEISLVVDTILSSVVFDGTYEVTVEIIDTTDVNNQEVIETQDYSMAVLHDSGLEFSVVDTTTGLEVELLEDDKYAVSYASPKVKVVARLLAGGLSPMDMFLYNNEEYMATDLLGMEFVGSEIDFSGRLFGDYTVPVAFELSKYNREIKEYELVEFSDEELKVNVLYGEYELNTLAMNTATSELELSESYRFNGNAKDGVVYVLLNENKVNTMFDLYSIANLMFEGDDYITYSLSNSEYEDVLSTYDEATATVSFEEYLTGIVLDDSAVLSLINEGLTVTYRVVVVGDVNGDNKITEEDLVDLVNQVVGEKEVDVEKSDLYNNDGEVTTLDVMYLAQVMKNSTWDVTITNQLENSIAAELQVIETDIVSGQEFTVNYIVKLSDYMVNGVAGLFTYDENVLELKSVKTANEWLGNSKDGKFLYVGEESLTLPVIEDTDEEVTEPETPEVNEEVTNTPVVEETVVENIDSEINNEVNTETNEPTIEDTDEVIKTCDYVVVSATFTAKKAGTHTISVENREYFNQDTYYGVEETSVSVEVIVNASDNNNLSSLVIAGQEIILEEDKLDYEITVSSDVTTAEVVAMVQNVAANITSIVSPEELVEGENTITITVTAESGDVKVYTIKVIREDAPEEETTTQVNYSNSYENNDDDKNEEEVVVTEPEENDDEDTTKEEESNLSRIVIIILILLVIAGLIYLIFKDEDDNETKKVNKEVNKLRKEEKIPEMKKEDKVNNKPINKSNNKNNSKNNNKNKNSKNKNKER